MVLFFSFCDSGIQIHKNHTFPLLEGREWIKKGIPIADLISVLLLITPPRPYLSLHMESVEWEAETEEGKEDGDGSAGGAAHSDCLLFCCFI